MRSARRTTIYERVCLDKESLSKLHCRLEISNYSPSQPLFKAGILSLFTEEKNTVREFEIFDKQQLLGLRLTPRSMSRATSLYRVQCGQGVKDWLHTRQTQPQADRWSRSTWGVVSRADSLHSDVMWWDQLHVGRLPPKQPSPQNHHDKNIR